MEFRVGRGVGGCRGQEFNTKIKCDSTPRQILLLNILLPAANKRGYCWLLVRNTAVIFQNPASYSGDPGLKTRTG